MIKICNLSKSFKKQKVLKSIDLTLPEKGIVSFVGPSGCGKTTLLNCISGLLNFDGDIQINKQNIKSLSDYDLSIFRLKTIGFVFQDYKLFEAQDIYSNIIFPFESICVDSVKHKKDKVVDLLKLVSLKKKPNTKINKLSGGEKQRVAIAGILAMKPDCMIFDESTAMLDPLGRRDIMNTIETLNREHGITIIMITHYMDEAARADKIVVLDDGEILMEGTPAKVFSNPEKLEACGLDVPQCVGLVHSLRKKGIIIRRQ